LLAQEQEGPEQPARHPCDDAEQDEGGRTPGGPFLLQTLAERHGGPRRLYRFSVKARRGDRPFGVDGNRFVRRAYLRLLAYPLHIRSAP
jgi:hypothetical protein